MVVSPWEGWPSCSQLVDFDHGTGVGQQEGAHGWEAGDSTGGVLQS